MSECDCDESCSGVDIQALMKEYVDEEGGAEVEAGEEDIYKNADE